MIDTFSTAVIFSASIAGDAAAALAALDILEKNRKVERAPQCRKMRAGFKALGAVPVKCHTGYSDYYRG